MIVFFDLLIIFWGFYFKEIEILGKGVCERMFIIVVFVTYKMRNKVKFIDRILVI